MNHTRTPIAPVQSGYVPVQGLRLYYEIYGEGRPLVLIHGGGSTIHTTFGNILPFFADHRKVIAFELQAHGHTEDRPTPSSFEQDADDVVEAMQHLRIPKVDIFGFSKGGNTAMQVAIRYPGMVRRLVVSSSFYKRDAFSPGFWTMMEDPGMENMPRSLIGAYLEINPDPQGLAQMHSRDRIRMLEFRDWPDIWIRGMRIPTLLIQGDQDVIAPEHAVALFRLLPRGRLIILPGAHGEYLGESTAAKLGSRMPELTATLVDDFLNSEELEGDGSSRE